MNRTPAERIINFLSFSDQSGETAMAFPKFSPRDWSRVQQWLDDASLPFVFLQRLRDTHTTRLVPPSLLSRLERNLALNRTRTEDLLTRFQSINRKFNEVGVLHAVVKGFSLVPEFCSAADLRYQADIDYLIEPQSLAPARRALIDAGYIPKQPASSKEFVFVSPGARSSRDDSQYSSAAGHAIELHTDIWDSEIHRLPKLPQFLRADQARSQYWNDLVFFALSDADAFLLQVLHACHHLFSQWIRMSCFFEIGYFMNRRASDAALWRAVEERVQDNTVVREFVVIVAELVAQLFGPPLPSLIQDWGAKIRPAVRVWIENYARSWALWAFCDLPVLDCGLFPRSKLVYFLQQQYRAEAMWRALDAHNPPQVPELAKSSNLAEREPLWFPRTGWLKRNRLIRRGIHYALGQARYACELPRWYWLNRT